MRGEDGALSFLSLLCSWVIPAGAGRMIRFCRDCRSSTGHPRRRGEHMAATKGNGLPSGSSPQARGGWLARSGLGAFGRVIPAGAGRIAAFLRPRRRCWGHPRRRGEDQHSLSHAPPESGSSPQARGGLKAAEVALISTGVIPAGAGRIWDRSMFMFLRGGHPRRRGEDG